MISLEKNAMKLKFLLRLLKLDGKHVAQVNGSYNLADIITGRRTVSSLSCIEKYGYLTKHYCPLDQESLFKKKVVKSGETKT